MWLLLLSAVPFVYAEAGEPAIVRVPVAAAEVDRPLVLGKGWLEASVGVDFKRATGAWTTEGEAVEWDDATWTHTTERVSARYGVSRDVELYASLPFHYVELRTSAVDNPAAFGLGEPVLGARYQFFTRQIPTSSVLFDVKAKVPTSSGSAGTYIGQDPMAGFAMSTGQADLALAVRGKQQLGPFAATASLAFVQRFASIDALAVYVGEQRMDGRFKPGNEVEVTLSPMLQLGPMALRGDFVYRQWFPAAVLGPSGGAEATLVPDSDGWGVDAGGGLIVHAARAVDLELSVRVPVRGESLAFFPLESLSPTRGATYAGAVRLRI